MEQATEQPNGKRELVSAWSEFLNRFEYDCFFTLTYREPAQSAMLAIDRASRLLGKFYDNLDRPLNAFVVAEQHRNGSYHAHGLLELKGLDREADVMLCRALWQAGYDKFGLCRFELVRDGGQVRNYVSKYLVKRVADHRFIGG